MKSSNNATNELNVCVIGLGMGYTHARHFSDMPEEVNLYVCDVDASKVERAQNELNVVGSFSSVHEVMSSSVIEAVDIVLPHHLHRPVAVQAAKAGMHSMTEKPIALNLKEADEMLEAAAVAGTRLAVAENYQFMSDGTEASRLIASGLIGEVFMVRVHELWRIGPRPGSWWFQRDAAGGGNLMSLGTHLVRTLRALAGGQAEQVFALFSDRVSPELYLEGEDTSLLAVRFDNGVIGNLVTSWATRNPGPSPRFAVYGTDGSIISDGNDTLLVYSRGIEGVQPTEAEMRIDLARHPNRDAFAAECREFVRWVQTGGDSPIKGEEGRKDLEIVEAAYRSASSGEAVRLPL